MLKEDLRSVQHVHTNVQMFRIVWKASIWKEKWVSQCLLNETVPAVSNSPCFHAQPIGLDSMRKCGLSLKLLEERCDLLKSCCSVAER